MRPGARVTGAAIARSLCGGGGRCRRGHRRSREGRAGFAGLCGAPPSWRCCGVRRPGARGALRFEASRCEHNSAMRAARPAVSAARPRRARQLRALRETCGRDARAPRQFAARPAAARGSPTRGRGRPRTSSSAFGGLAPVAHPCQAHACRIRSAFSSCRSTSQEETPNSSAIASVSRPSARMEAISSTGARNSAAKTRPHAWRDASRRSLTTERAAGGLAVASPIARANANRRPAGLPISPK